uniref:EGF-like domain-containing protein n=1 Tax=Anopheles atroparvus TaxID=41427 RepID=A0A182JMQ3_ANOAO
MNRKVLPLFLLVATFFASTRAEEIAIEQILSLCCQDGEEWGIQNRLCSTYNKSLELVPAGLHGLCLSTIEICCSKQHKIYQCTAGQIAARQGLSCSLKGDHSGSEFYTDCCEACKIGLVVGSSANKCSVEPFAFGSPWDEIYDGCCNDIKTEGEIILLGGHDEQGLCDQFPTICSQVCENVEGGSYVCKCHPGFELQNDRKTCAPVSDEDNEAIEQKLCEKGFQKNARTNECEDVDECETGEASCDAARQICRNSRGGFQCVDIILPDIACDAGYQPRDGKCEDIDECAADKNACDSNQVCTNEIGGFRCDCKIGFILDAVTNACVDINECQVNAHECLETQRCDNTIGSYTCIRLQSCGTGYTLNAETGHCDDDDECALRRHNCRPPMECFNTKGSFRCRQPYKYQSSARTYTSTSTSTSTTTSTTAQPYRARYSSYQPYLPPCGIGFERNALGACVDIDECTTGEAQCGPDQTCKNKQGGYVCVCPPGHMIGRSQHCEDIDECAMYGTKVCPHNSNCVNTVGSYRCDCTEGFKKHSPNEMLCTDVDECKEMPGLCHQRCLNYWGSYRCGCNPGYRLSYNNRTCDDVDECEEYKSANLCVGNCENTPGSYACSCPPGYNLGADGRSCIDIDECHKREVCNGHYDVCTNIGGSYRCTSIECPYGYRHDADRRNRCERSNRYCNVGDTECIRRPHSYSYNFLTIVSNIPVPPEGRGLFTLAGPQQFELIEFDLKLVSVDAAPHVRPVDMYYFSLDKKTNEAQLNLKKSIEGPQDIELELKMTVFQNGQLYGSNVAKLFLMISAYEY